MALRLDLHMTPGPTNVSTQHKSADQPSSETGVEATNAEVTGPGMYTVGLKFNWQKAEGAIQFNLVLDNAESLFPGYYVKITE